MSSFVRAALAKLLVLAYYLLFSPKKNVEFITNMGLYILALVIDHGSPYEK